MSIFTKTYVTKASHSAAAMGSGSLEVLATPAVVAFMENVACAAIQDHLSDQETTVGSAIAIKHLAASKIGNPIIVHVTALKEEGRAFHFDLRAYDADKLIATANHTRIRVKAQAFLNKVNQ